MNNRLCVYNLTRQSFLSLGVTPADTMWSRMVGLIGRVKLGPDDGVWVLPSRGIHTIGLLFPIDLIYLDENCRVVHIRENLGTFRVAPLRKDAASVLELKTRTVYESGTQVGDELLICRPEEFELRCSAPTEQRLRPTGT